MATLFVPQDFINFLIDLLSLDSGALNDIELLNINIIDDYILLLPFLTNYDRGNVLNAYVEYLKNRSDGYTIIRDRALQGDQQPSLQKFIWLSLNGKLQIDHLFYTDGFWIKDEINRLYRVNNGPELDPPG